MASCPDPNLSSCCDHPAGHGSTPQQAATPHEAPAELSSRTVPADHTSNSEEHETLSILDEIRDEIRSEETPADVTAVQAAGFGLLLETGRPVTVDDLITATEVPAERVAEIFESVRARGRVEFDDEGRLIGLAGLTLTPSRHRLTINGATRWTWCALDAVGILGALHATGTVESTNPQTGDEIEIGFVDGRPDGKAHLFILDGYTDGNVRQDWCPRVNFFTSRQDAEEWGVENGLQGDIVAVAEIADDAAAMWVPVVDLDAPRSAAEDHERRSPRRGD